jgi:hypothetical protein
MAAVTVPTYSTSPKLTGAGTPRNFYCHNALICMAYENRVKPAASGVEREARLEKRRVEAEQAMEERRKADAAFRANYERLRAERLAREAKRQVV